MTLKLQETKRLCLEDKVITEPILLSFDNPVQGASPAYLKIGIVKRYDPSHTYCYPGQLHRNV